MTRKKKWEDRIETITQRARDELAKLGEEYREQVLIPLCRKHKLTFVSGMGSFCFWTKINGHNEWIGDHEAAKQYRKTYLIPIIDLLNYEAMYLDDHFGFYVRDINESDL